MPSTDAMRHPQSRRSLEKSASRELDRSTPSRWRRIIAGALAIAALLLAATPWFGDIAPPLDPAAGLLPLGPLAAVAALLVGGIRSLVGLAAGVALAVSGGMVASEWSGLPNGDDGARLRVVTQNLGSANADPEATIRTLIDARADVLLLQEVDGTAAPWLGRLRATYPFGSVCRRPCSLAILSRWPTSRVRYRMRDVAGEPYGPALVQTIVYRPDIPPFRVVSLHLSRHLSAKAARREREDLAATLSRAGRSTLIVGGDFNMTPWSSAMRSFDAQLAPVRRISHGLLSFPARWRSYRIPAPVLAIDHIYAGPCWAPARTARLCGGGSDHYPVAVELIWQRRCRMIGHARG